MTIGKAGDQLKANQLHGAQGWPGSSPGGAAAVDVTWFDEQTSPIDLQPHPLRLPTRDVPAD